MLASSLLVHHVMLTCAFMISVRLSDLLTQAKLFAPFLFAMVIAESRVYSCWSPIDVPPAELWHLPVLARSKPFGPEESEAF